MESMRSSIPTMASIEPLVDRIQAVLDAGADYQTYTDIADGVNGSVKFIIKTDAVKAED